MTMTESTYQCPFHLPAGSVGDRPNAHKLHGQAAGLAYAMYDPRADKEEPSDLLRSAKYVQEMADGVMRDVVSRCRDEGMTWEQIALTLGLKSKQVAQQRFGRKR